MRCACGEHLATVWALRGEVWQLDGRTYCSPECAGWPTPERPRRHLVRR